MPLLQDIFAQALNGLAYGVLLFLLSAGLTLVFGMLGVVNLAHGSFYMLGAYAGLTLVGAFDSFWLALLVAPLVVALVGALIERICLRPLYPRGPLSQILLTFGLVYLFEDLVKWIYGGKIRSVAPPDLFARSVTVWGSTVPSYRLFVIAFGLVMALGLFGVIERTRLGAVVRAGVFDSEMAAGMGIDIDRVFTGVFAFGAALAGLSGVIAGPIQSVQPPMGGSILIPALIVVVVGGLGSLKGSLAGSLLIGQAQTFGKAWLPGASMLVIYVLMATILLLRRGARPEAAPLLPVPYPRRALRLPQISPRLAAFVAIGALAVFPSLVGPYPVRLLHEILIWGLFAMSLDLLMGYAGMVSLGHSAFFGIGGYVGALGLVHWPNLASALLLPAVAGALAALVIGFFSSRVSGVYFIMLTLAFSQMFYAVAFQSASLGAEDGLVGVPRPSGMMLAWPMGFHLYLLLVVALAAFGLHRIVRSPFGHVLSAMHDNETRLEAVGYAVSRYKLVAFVIAGSVAAVAGSLYAQEVGSITPDAFLWTTSGEALLMVIIGGTGTLVGPVLGAAAFILLQSIVSSYTERWMLILGVAFVILVLFAPRGIVGVVRARLPAKS